MLKNDRLLNDERTQTADINQISAACLASRIALAHAHRRRADTYLNLYLNSYVMAGEGDLGLAAKCFADYEKASWLFAETGQREARGDALQAYGNALKERHLPYMEAEAFHEFQSRSAEKYAECIAVYGNDVRGYHFTLLEQMNLSVRREVWDRRGRPKRVAILHSLKSAISHRILHGIRYFAFRNGCELWEYHYGRVPRHAKDDAFIGDRLKDASGVVFLAASDYDMARSIIRREVEETVSFKKAGDPLGVFAVDLGNQTVVDALGDAATVVPPDDFADAFEAFLNGDLRDIYECRAHRCR